MASNGTPNLVDELEEAFQNCVHALTKEEPTSGEELSEIKQEVDQTTIRFIDLARQMEGKNYFIGFVQFNLLHLHNKFFFFSAFFLQKRFLLSNMKPDLLLKEENFDLKQEIQRKDELIRRHYEKIDQWKVLLQDPPPNTFAKMVPSENRQIGSPMQPPPHMGVPAASSPLHAAQVAQQSPHMMQMQPNQQMYMQQAGMRPNFPQGPLAYLEKTTNNIDMVGGLGDVRR